MDIDFQIYVEFPYRAATQQAVERLGMPYADAQVLRLGDCPVDIPLGAPMAVMCQSKVTLIDAPLKVLKYVPRHITNSYTRPCELGVQNVLRTTTMDAFQAKTPDGMSQLLTSLLPRVYDQLHLAYSQACLAMLARLSNPKDWPMDFTVTHAQALHELNTVVQANVLSLQTARNSASVANAWLQKFCKTPL